MPLEDSKSLKTLFPDESINQVISQAIQKADQQRYIRDKLSNYKHLDEESKTKRLHFKLLGRVGYDRLPIPNITEINNIVFIHCPNSRNKKARSN
jgi:hypothetical protein